MISQRSSFVFVLAAAGLAASQSLSSLGISQKCQDTLSGTLIGNNDLAQCLNSVAALNIFATSSNSSIVQPVDSWLQGVCSAPACSNSTITQAAQNITTGCQSDLAAIGLSSGDTQTIINTVLQVYPTVRKVACLKDSKASGQPLCVTELLDDIQSIIGPLSTNNLITTVQGVIAGNSTVSIPTNVTCNDCTQAAWAIIKQDDPSVTQSSSITDPISSQCGSDFLNASQPSDIVESSGTSTPGAALGMRISFEKMVTVAAVPLVGLLAGTAILF